MMPEWQSAIKAAGGNLERFQQLPMAATLKVAFWRLDRAFVIGCLILVAIPNVQNAGKWDSAR